MEVVFETMMQELPSAVKESNNMKMLNEQGNRYERDLKMNWKSFGKSALSERELILTGISLAANNGNSEMQRFLTEQAVALEIPQEEIADAIAAAGLLSANNVLYRFRHFMNDENYNNMPARLRMQAMMNPAVGKELFELMSLAISAVNGCEMCVTSHEHSLRELGVSREKIWDAIRFASLFESISIFRTGE